MGKVIEPSSALAHRVAAREFLRGSIAVPPSTTAVQKPQNPLPQKPSPSLGPERMDDLEDTCGNRHHADKYRADDRNEHDVAQHQESCQDHFNSKQNADPKGWRGPYLGV